MSDPASGHHDEAVSKIASYVAQIRDLVGTFPASARNSALDVLLAWKMAILVLQARRCPPDIDLGALLRPRFLLDSALPSPVLALLERANNGFETVVERAGFHLGGFVGDTHPSRVTVGGPQEADRNTHFSPYQFGHNHHNWSLAQEMSDTLLCGRPVSQTGLPIVTFNTVFLDFSLFVSSKGDLPRDDTVANAAILVAAKLRERMGDAFPTETERSRAFNQSLHNPPDSPLFHQGHWSAQYRVGGLGAIGYADQVYFFSSPRQGYPVIIREDKDEPGSNGDAQMQVACTYKFFVKSIRLRSASDQDAKSLLEDGVPTFLVCVTGAMVIVFGAYYDGRKYLVEPLTPFQSMLKPKLHDLQRDDLARLMYALHNGVSELERAKLCASPLRRDSRPGVPRIYTTCASLPPTVHPTIFYNLDLVSCLGAHETVFEGKCTRGFGHSEEEDVIVKLVARDYGADVQHYLASHGLAPYLKAIAAPKGAPPAYVMERLRDNDWLSLAHVRDNTPDQYLSARLAIGRSLDRIIDMLEDAQLVHGNLEPENILVEVDETGEPLVDKDGFSNLKVVDFEVAGSLGSARHRVDCRDMGALIPLDHDRLSVQSWL